MVSKEEWEKSASLKAKLLKLSEYGKCRTPQLEPVGDFLFYRGGKNPHCPPLFLFNGNTDRIKA